MCVNLAADFLETAGRVLAAEPRIGDFTVADLYLKRGTLDAAVQRTFAWLNAKVTMADTRAISVEYHTWWFRAAIRSEDRWETRLKVTINAASGVEVDLPDPFDQWGLRPRARPAGRRNRRTRLPPPGSYRGCRRRRANSSAAWTRGWRPTAGGCASTMGPWCGRPNTRRSPAAASRPMPEKLAAKKRAVDLELRRKLAELEQRYAMEAVLEPLVLIVRNCPCWPSTCWCSASGPGARTSSTGTRS